MSMCVGMIRWLMNYSVGCQAAAVAAAAVAAWHQAVVGESLQAAHWPAFHFCPALPGIYQKLPCHTLEALAIASQPSARKRRGYIRFSRCMYNLLSFESHLNWCIRPSTLPSVLSVRLATSRSTPTLCMLTTIHCSSEYIHLIQLHDKLCWKSEFWYCCVGSTALCNARFTLSLRLWSNCDYDCICVACMPQQPTGGSLAVLTRTRHQQPPVWFTSTGGSAICCDHMYKQNWCVPGFQFLNLLRLQCKVIGWNHHMGLATLAADSRRLQTFQQVGVLAIKSWQVCVEVAVAHGIHTARLCAVHTSTALVIIREINKNFEHLSIPLLKFFGDLQ